MKKSGSCPKCQGRRIGRLAGVPDQTKGGGLRAIAEEKDTWFATYHGLVEAYVCTECGYFEEYVFAAGDVPWEKLLGFSWHAPRGAGSGPFR